MTRNETLVLIPVALQVATLWLAFVMGLRPGNQGDADRQRLGAELWRRSLAISLIFFIAIAVALHWRVVDAYVMTFAVLFVLAQAVHAAVLARGDDASPLALRASVVALTGLVAVIALDILPEQADTLPVP